MTRTASLWGWGWADRFPNDEARLQLGQMVEALTGFRPAGLGKPPTLDSLVLPKSRIERALVASTSAPEARARHTYGKAYPDLIRGFSGDFGSAPDLVATPRTEREIETILETAEKERWAVVPYGGGTSVTGGVECKTAAHAGVISLDLSAFDRVMELDQTSRLARIQAGAKGPHLEEQLGKDGYTLRHFPQSFEHSTLGGWIATRAGGHFATLYTHIDDLVASTRMITPGGLWASRTLPASGAGPSPDRLVLGSEGAFGVITEATVRVRPRPKFKAGATVHFPRFVDGVHAARALAQSGLYPSNCRLLDEREAALFGVTADRTAVLIVAFESDDHPLDPWLARALELVKDHGGAPQAIESGGGADLWKQAFLDAPYLQSSLVSLGILADTFETACTWSAFEALHSAVIRAVRDAQKRTLGAGFISCRFTHVYPDGPAPYYTFLGPVTPGAELAAWAEIKNAASEALLANGATITHHHSVGRTHRPWYQREVPALFTSALRGVKRAVDPTGIMNPGVLFD